MSRLRTQLAAICLLTATIFFFSADIGKVNAAILPPPPPATITLAWDPSPSPGITGYNLHYGTASRSYTNTLNAGSATTCVVTNLTRGVTYYFSATARDMFGLESNYSVELSYVPPIVVKPQLKIQKQLSGAMTITGTGIAGYVYSVQVSENLKSWVNLATIAAGPAGELQYSDANAKSFKKRYYRLQQL